jgi:inhibitor of cysteine peptidase
VLAAGAAVLAVVALGAALLAACGGSGEPDERGTPATIRVTPAVAATTVPARVGDTVVVSLAANATTGYEWSFTAGDTFVIEKSEYVEDPNPEQLVGKGGTLFLTLRVTEAGSSDLIGTYARSWETPSPDAQPGLVLTIESGQ